MLRHCRIPPTLTVSLAFQSGGSVSLTISNTNEHSVVGQLSSALTTYGFEHRAEGGAPETVSAAPKSKAQPSSTKAKTKKSVPIEPQEMTLSSLKASVTYVPMNEVCTEDVCAGRVVLLDSIGDFVDRVLAAVSFGCRGVVLAVHETSLFKPLNLTKLKATAEPADAPIADVGGGNEDAASSAGRFDDGNDTDAKVSTDFPKLSLPVVCVTKSDATWLRNAIGVPHDLDPDVLVPQMYTSRLKALGYSEELCARALQRGKYDFGAALAWLESNAKFFVDQSSMMAELDAVVAAKSLDAKPQPSVEPTPAAVAFRSVSFAPADSAAPAEGIPTKLGGRPEESDDEVIATATELLVQDECWPLASRWQKAFRNNSVVVSDRYDLSAITRDVGLSDRTLTAQDQQWLSDSEAATLRQSSLTGLLRTWVAVQFELTVTYCRRAFVRSGTVT